MSSFTLRSIDPAFWQRVQAKAAAEGVTVKALILRLLAAWLAAVLILFIVGCGYESPTAPTPPAGPTAGVPSRIELSATPGMGVDGGTGTITARVLDAFSTTLPDQPVTFTVSEGALAASQVRTDAAGVARTSVTGTAGAAIVITAATGTVVQKTQVAIQPRPVQGPAPTPPIPAPPVPEPPPPTPGTPTYAVNLFASPGSLEVGGTATLSATYTPLFGAPQPTLYRWDCNGDAVVDFTTATPSQVCNFPTAGTVPVAVQLVGGIAQGIGTASITVSTPPVPPPPALTVTLTSSAGMVVVGGTLTFTAVVTNREATETIVAFQWDLDGNAGFDFTTTASSQRSSPYNRDGLFTARVQVTTSTGRTATAAVNFVVTSPSGA